MLRKEALVAISCNISSSPRLIDVAFLGCACCAKVMWAGIHSDWRACRTLSNNRKLCLECFNSRSTGTLYRRTQGSSLTGLESSWANQRARCFTWSQKLAWQRKLLRETDAMLSESQLAMLRKEALVAIGCNISSPRLIDVAFLGCACCAEGHVGRHTQWLVPLRSWCLQSVWVQKLQARMTCF